MRILLLIVAALLVIWGVVNMAQGQMLLGVLLLALGIFVGAVLL